MTKKRLENSKNLINQIVGPDHQTYSFDTETLWSSSKWGNLYQELIFKLRSHNITSRLWPEIFSTNEYWILIYLRTKLMFAKENEKPKKEEIHRLYNTILTYSRKCLNSIWKKKLFPMSVYFSIREFCKGRNKIRYQLNTANELNISRCNNFWHALPYFLGEILTLFS